MTNRYVVGELARALTTAAEHEDPATRQRALARARSWADVLDGIGQGRIVVGSRSPVQGLPAWATPEVARGGFATGRALAGGPLEPDELERAAQLGLPASRAALFAWCLTEPGLAHLLRMLDERAFRVQVPEDGALLTAAALVRAGHRAAALELLETLRPYADTLRFLPRAGHPSGRPADHVHRRTAAEVRQSLRAISLDARIETQREALAVWLPLTDRFVQFWSAQQDGPLPWEERVSQQARELLAAYDTAGRQHPRCRKYHNPKENLPILVAAARAAVDGELSPHWLARVRHVLACIVAKRGAPQDPIALALRAVQARVAELPAHAGLARLAAARLNTAEQDEGVLDVTALLGMVSAQEQSASIPQGTPMPEIVGRTMRLALSAPVEVLIERGVIPSAEVLAELVPALTAQQVAAGVTDPALGAVLGATYAAFRRRRTLLLLNLEKQVQFSELPWVAGALEATGGSGRPDDPLAVARRVAALAVDSFPGTILPNPLISELSTLYAAGAVSLPLTEELAADIFMGRFSPKFVAAARLAAQTLAGSRYERYYRLDFAELLALTSPPGQARPGRRWRRSPAQPAPPVAFEMLCSRGVPDGDVWSVARNGMIIERQQLLTTHNLAALLHHGGVRPRRSWSELALAAAGRTALLLRLTQDQPRPLSSVKDAAYAWRQAVFFVSSAPADTQPDLIAQMRSLRDAGTWPMSQIIDGLAAAGGAAVDGRADDGTDSGDGPFLGWTVGPHWVLGRRRTVG